MDLSPKEDNSASQFSLEAVDFSAPQYNKRDGQVLDLSVRRSTVMVKQEPLPCSAALRNSPLSTPVISRNSPILFPAVIKSSSQPFTSATNQLQSPVNSAFPIDVKNTYSLEPNIAPQYCAMTLPNNESLANTLTVSLANIATTSASAIPMIPSSTPVSCISMPSRESPPTSQFVQHAPYTFTQGHAMPLFEGTPNPLMCTSPDNVNSGISDTNSIPSSPSASSPPSVGVSVPLPMHPLLPAEGSFSTLPMNSMFLNQSKKSTRPFKAVTIARGLSNEDYEIFKKKMLEHVKKMGPKSSASKKRQNVKQPSSPEPSSSSGGTSIEGKDAAYWERRKKNNEAAKRSRDARRAKEDELAIRTTYLEQENLMLRYEVAHYRSCGIHLVPSNYVSNS